jgi:glycosyltransferase involved in cell wall biosynthesis
MYSFFMTIPLPSLTVCIPAYGRHEEYSLLLKSLANQILPPTEILVCEDGSAQREQLRRISAEFAPKFKQMGCEFRFIENATNLGYDGNLRELISLATGDYVFFIGNDDYILSDGIKTAREFLAHHPVLASSRSFLRFHDDPQQPVGVSRLFNQDMILNRHNSGAGMMQRMGGFFGGLVFNREWAKAQSTHIYDGTLYYQIYLLLKAYATGDIGYIAKPTVAARADNAPLFGSAQSEQGFFIPGRYTAASRGRMWASILKIARDCERDTQVAMFNSMKQELSGRMSFHVFEMFAGRSTEELDALRTELVKLKLFDHPLPRLLYWVNRLTGRYARHLYTLARRFIQR